MQSRSQIPHLFFFVFVFKQPFKNVKIIFSYQGQNQETSQRQGEACGIVCQLLVRQERRTSTLIIRTVRLSSIIKLCTGYDKDRQERHVDGTTVAKAVSSKSRSSLKVSIFSEK